MGKDSANKLFGSVPRVRLMRLFLFSPKARLSLTEILYRTKLHRTEARRELKLLREAGLVRATRSAKVRYSLNEKFPYLTELQHLFLDASLSRKGVLDRFRRIGSVKFLGVAGVFMGDFDDRLDLIIAGDRIKERRLKAAVRALEADLGTELRYTSLPTQDFLYRLTISDRFVRDFFDYPHEVVYDRLNASLG